MSISDEDYARLLALRSGLRHFQRWSERQARAAGLTPAQHQLLLAIRGHGDPRGPTVGEVADYLLLRHHSTVELIDRADRAGLVTRCRDATDQRIVRLRLTEAGAERLEALSALHLEELQRLARRLPGVWRGLAPVQRTHGFPGHLAVEDGAERVTVDRVYGRAERKGERVILVDRLWPRGLAKDDAPFDQWLREVAPSTELRRWYGHASERFDEFTLRYSKELARGPAKDAFEQLQQWARRGDLVLVTATRELDLSAAAVLRNLLIED